jgi:hypothetical protein
MRWHSLFGVLSFLLTANNSFSQQFNVRTYSFKEGLNTYNIKKVVQDKYGFIWLRRMVFTAMMEQVLNHSGKAATLTSTSEKILLLISH